MKKRVSLKNNSIIKRIHILILVLFFCQLGAAQKKATNEIVLNRNGIFYNIEVINDELIHVVKSKHKDYKPLLDNLSIIKNAENIQFDVSEDNGTTIVKTKKVVLYIDKSGVIRFVDTNGKALLSELKGGHKLTEAPSSNAIYQGFSSGDEAFYGLGQFQSGILNWKNTPIQLRQYNQEIAIPFLVSTNHYGILWNNNSITDFNHPEQEISFSKTIDEENNIREAEFTANTTGEYAFYVESPNPEKNRRDGPVLLTINDKPIINYTTIWVPDCHVGKINLEKGKTYKVVLQNSNSQTKGRLFVNGPDFNKTTFASKKGKAIDYYFVYGETPTDILDGYRELTGKAPMFPKWAFGFWQCRERYHNQEELLENAREYRKRNIPLDNIVQDWHYWREGTKGPSWNPETYPNPKAMCDELESLNLNLMVSVWPEAKDKELLTRYGLEEHKLVHKRSTRDIYYLDFYNPKVAEGFANVLRDSMYNIGVDAIWLDGTEPQDPPHDWTQTHAGSWDEVTNSYSLVVNKAAYEGKMKHFPNQRVFNLTRSAFTGQQRYSAASWSGDVAATWEQFAEQIPAGLNFCMAGIPYWTTDIGGFFRDGKSLNGSTFKDQYKSEEYKELLTRWFQYGTFCPLFRIHGYVSDTEIWRYGKAFETTARDFINLRYQLMPYIYSTAWNVTKNNGSMMTPLAYSFPNDKNAWDIGNQFLFGDNIMVCPVTEYKARNRTVYLPEGTWFDFWTNKVISGGKEISADAPLNKLPLYVKAGTILPLGPKVQYSTQKLDKPIEIVIYEGANAEFVLYQDDNLSNDYLKGAYAEFIFSYNDNTSKLTIRKKEGNYIDLKKTPQSFIVKKAGESKGQKVTFKGKTKVVKL
ncbi:glycoside hydrolase family 31 protein [Flavivirga eckloniae]|uniref:PA14 domain-containing protein n=1 Tax=Flavivirga eckloniae TaxID=1803846 RepID=A0A2K9PWF1_9FLAO|nr:TIM-barrel domain-containing protein [Flavivirga eckloniae]AUP80857.1 hypothetical protein C1H87_19945 [Flavivirga eckloniae]